MKFSENSMEARTVAAATPSGIFAKVIEEKDAEIRRLKELILRCPKCGTKLRYPRG